MFERLLIFFEFRASLQWAAQNGYLELARLLLERGADVEQRDNKGCTALYWAARNGHFQMVRLLLERGADVNQRDYWGQTALHLAAENGHVEVVRLLLEQGADVNQARNDGVTPLHSAAYRGHIEVVRLLLQQGADFNQADENGITALMHTVNFDFSNHNRYLDLCHLLLEAGANVNLLNNSDDTALNIALRTCTPTAVCLLLKHGANMNQASEREWRYFLLHSAFSSYDQSFLALYGVNWPSGGSELRALFELGACLRAAQTEARSQGAVSEATRRDWETLYANNPWLPVELARLSPALYLQEKACLGSHADIYWWGKTALPTLRPMGFLQTLRHFMVSGVSRFFDFFRQQPKIPAIRRAAMDYLKAQAATFPDAPQLSDAVNRVLKTEVQISADGNWEMGELTSYWGEHKTLFNTHFGTALQMWELADGGWNSHKAYPSPVFLSWLRQMQADSRRDWLTASCGLPGMPSSDASLMKSRFQNCQRLAEWARMVIFNKEDSWDSLLAEIQALKAFPDYPLQEDLRYFFDGILKAAWECDKGVFGTLDGAQKNRLCKLAQYAAECPAKLQSRLLESKPEEPDAAPGFDAKAVDNTDNLKEYLDALSQVLANESPSAISAVNPKKACTLLYSSADKPAVNLNESKEEVAHRALGPGA